MVEKTQNPHTQDFPGDYDLKAINILPDFDRAIDIKEMVMEMNIYEGIQKGAITGTLVCVDANNLIENIPIQGIERLDFQLKTAAVPTEYAVDASERTGHPFYIYQVSDRKQLNDGTMSYILHFCSRSFLRNIRHRVSRTYTGSLEEIATTIYQDKFGFDCRKKLIYEETKNTSTITVPNMRPIDAIKMIGDNAVGSTHNGVGYLFYETTKAWHFRSLESLFSLGFTGNRPIKAHFRYTPKLVGKLHKEEQDYYGIIDYQFVQNFDVAGNQMLGGPANRVITHNIHNKTWKIYDHSADEDWEDHHHLNAERFNLNAPIDSDPVPQEGRDKGLSDYPESRTMLVPTTQYKHGSDTGNFGLEVDTDGLRVAKRLTQRVNILNGDMLKMTVVGHSDIEAGDVIQVDIPSLEPKGNTNKFNNDDYHAGRYIIREIRHKIVKEHYHLILLCVKDSNPNKRPEAYIEDKFKGNLQDYSIEKLTDSSEDGSV
tara:strand:+ start:314 stop:1768 length:1455 start_codon:yes stop_codon:yes gene_type:complete